MARQFAKRVEIVGVAGRDDVAPMEDFVARHDLGHVRHAADVDGVLWQRFGIVAQPAWVFVDGETGEVTRQLGALSGPELTARLEALASEG